jgi:ankyrin repeat protein
MTESDVIIPVSINFREELMNACTMNELEMIKSYVERFNINVQKLEDNYQLLHIACYFGYEELFDYLMIQQPKALNVTDKIEGTALHVAIKNGHNNIALKILRCRNFHRADAIDGKGHNALFYALETKNDELINEVKKQSSDYHYANYEIAKRKAGHKTTLSQDKHLAKLLELSISIDVINEYKEQIDKMGTIIE